MTEPLSSKKASSVPSQRVERLRQEIERLAPQEPDDYPETRERLIYKELDRLPSDLKPAILERIYETIYSAQITERTFKKLEADGLTSDKYWGDVSRVHSAIDEQREALKSPVVREKPFIGIASHLGIQFYEPHEVYCRHKRPTNDCIAIREMLGELAKTKEALTAASACVTPKEYERRFILKAQCDSLTQRLMDEGVDAARAKPEDFCASCEPMEADPFALATLRGERTLLRPRCPGAAPDAFLDELVIGIIGKLTAAEWSQKKACTLLHRICVYCLGLPEDGAASVDALHKRWKRWKRDRHRFKANPSRE